jgi:hypothetical protein
MKEKFLSSILTGKKLFYPIVIVLISSGLAISLFLPIGIISVGMTVFCFGLALFLFLKRKEGKHVEST